MGTIIPLLTEFEKEHISERQALPEKYLGLSDEEMDRRIAAARATLGSKLVILGHHYQRDEVIRFADYTGDSFRLARQVAQRPEADYIVFCGVHFMDASTRLRSRSVWRATAIRRQPLGGHYRQQRDRIRAGIPTDVA